MSQDHPAGSQRRIDIQHLPKILPKQESTPGFFYIQPRVGETARLAPRIMKPSATDIAWEEKPEDITAQILARRVKKETMLREIVEQSALGFYMGGSALSSILRIGLLIALGVLYFPSKAFSSWGVWPVFALGSLVEARRANRRLDAMLELESITKAIDFDHRLPSGR